MTNLSYSTELVPVGRSACLHRSDCGATALLDANTAWLWRERHGTGAPERLGAKVAWRTGLSLKEAEAYVRNFEMQLESSGFLQPVTPAPCHVSEDKPVIADESGLITLNFGFEDGAPVSFATNDTALATLIGANVLQIEPKPGSNVTVRITAVKHGDHYVVARNGIVLVPKCDLSVVRRTVIYGLMQALLPQERIAAILHASTVALHGKGIVLAGSTGSGKTTLMMHLVSRGARYFCDDFTALDEHGAHVSNFPLAASLKSPIWDVLRPDFPGLDAVSPMRVGERTVRYMRPDSRERFKQERIKPSLLVFPTYSEGARTECKALYPEEALARLLQSGSEIVEGHKSIRHLANFVNHTPAINLMFADVQKAAFAIERETGCCT